MFFWEKLAAASGDASADAAADINIRKSKMGKKTIKELNLEIVKLRENHENEINDMKNRHDIVNEAFELLHKKYDMLMKKPFGSDAVKMCNACGVSMTTTREYKDHMRCHHSEESLNVINVNKFLTKNGN